MSSSENGRWKRKQTERSQAGRGVGQKTYRTHPPRDPESGARRFPPFSGANHSQSLALGSICRKPPPPPLQCTKRWGGVNRGRNKELNPAGPVSGRVAFTMSDLPNQQLQDGAGEQKEVQRSPAGRSRQCASKGSRKAEQAPQRLPPHLYPGNGARAHLHGLEGLQLKPLAGAEA